MPFPAGLEERVPVLIVGGGGAGLTASMLLARQRVGHLLVSARPQTSDLPKAHVLNQRAVEVLDEVGVAETIAERSTPAEQMAATAFYAGFAGPDPDYGRVLARLESWGAGGQDESWRAASPWRQLNLPQIRLEPLLKARAEELSPGRIRFDHELIGLDQDADGVHALIRDNGTGEDYAVHAEYLIGADGGRTIAGLTGVEYEGLGVVDAGGDAARVGRLLALGEGPGRPDPLDLLAPGRGLCRDGPDGTRALGTRVRGVGDPPQLPGRTRRHPDEQVEADVRKALGIGDLPMEIHKITRWSMDAVLASSFQVGRVFLIGDAAHRHPPTGGLGLTSAIHDAQNLCWKLAAVLAGDASPALLDTYEPERRPVDQRNCQRSLENGFNHFAIAGALGISPENSPEENMALLRRVWSDRPEDAEQRSNVQRLMRAQSMEFSELNVEYGYAYTSEAVVSDGSPEPTPLDDIRVYQPAHAPGRAPAARVGRRRGRQPPRDQGPRGAGAVPADRRRERRAVVRSRPAARGRRAAPARRRPDRAPRRGSVRPALLVASASPDRR